jgi:hypothetical protein
MNIQESVVWWGGNSGLRFLLFAAVDIGLHFPKTKLLVAIDPWQYCCMEQRQCVTDYTPPHVRIIFLNPLSYFINEYTVPCASHLHSLHLNQYPTTSMIALLAPGK